MAHLYKRQTRKGTCWHIQYIDADGERAYAKGYSSRKETEDLAATLERRVQDIRNGVLDSKAEAVKEARENPVNAYIDDWVKAIKAGKSRDESYAEQQGTRVKAVMRLAQIQRIDQIITSDVQVAVHAMMEDAEDGIGEQTASHYVQACKQFGRWLWKAKRWPEPLLDDLAKYHVTDARKRDEVPADVLVKTVALLESEAERKVSHWGVTGEVRAMLYLLAAETGLRRKSLCSLTPESFDLTPGKATVTVRAGSVKNARHILLPISDALAGKLGPFLATYSAGVQVFHLGRQCAKMIRADLRRAGFVTAGKGWDFHALRHTAISNWVRVAPNLAVAQKLAGHSTPTLTARYTHSAPEELRATVERVAPELHGESPKNAKFGNGTMGEGSGDRAGNGGRKDA